MDTKERQLFTLMWSLLGDYQTLLGDALPVFHQVVIAMDRGQMPSADQRQGWEKGYRAFDQRLHELTANFESLRQVADPLFGFDA